MNLDSLRNQIDSIDSQLITLINERMQLASSIGKNKIKTGESFYSPERENAIFRKLEEHNTGPLSQKSLRAIFREIISACIAEQKYLSIAYPEANGALAHSASKDNFGSAVNYISASTITDVLSHIENELADYGVIPIECSTNGFFNETIEALSLKELTIIAKIHKEHSQNNQSNLSNSTTFLIIGKQAPATKTFTAFHTSILISLVKEHNEIEAILSILAKHEIAITKILPAPSNHKPEECRFLIDTTGHWNAPHFQQAIQEITPLSTSLKWLGSFPTPL